MDRRKSFVYLLASLFEQRGMLIQSWKVMSGKKHQELFGLMGVNFWNGGFIKPMKKCSLAAHWTYPSFFIFHVQHLLIHTINIQRQAGKKILLLILKVSSHLLAFNCIYFFSSFKFLNYSATPVKIECYINLHILHPSQSTLHGSLLRQCHLVPELQFAQRCEWLLSDEQ